MLHGGRNDDHCSEEQDVKLLVKRLHINSNLFFFFHMKFFCGTLGGYQEETKQVLYVFTDRHRQQQYYGCFRGA
jgi:hypothetical protein